jgi:hypothetical protein
MNFHSVYQIGPFISRLDCLWCELALVRDPIHLSWILTVLVRPLVGVDLHRLAQLHLCEL